jgi:anti-sigma factor RsiW
VELSEDVILDLMPLYLGQSASAETRRLVEGYLVAHPELAARFARPSERVAAVVQDEVATLRRTRAALRQRDVQLAFAIACTVAPLTFWVDGGAGGTHVWMLLREVPSLAMAFWAMAAGFWVGFAVWSKRTRATGL